jgi:adhesin/invasin
VKPHWTRPIGVSLATALIASLSLLGLSALPASAAPAGFVTPAVVSNGNSSAIAGPTSVEADGVATSTVTVTVEDSATAPVVSDVVTLVHTSGSAVVTGTTANTSTTNGSGIATFHVTDTTAQSSTFTATDGGSLDVVSNLVTFTTPTASNTNSTITATSPIEADGVATSTVTVTVKDHSSVPINGDVVTLGANSGTSDIVGVTTALTSTTDNIGVATFTVSDTSVESPTYTATDSGSLDVTSTAVVFFTQVADDANSSITPTSPVPADGVDTSTVTVTVADNNDVPISGDVVTLAANSGTSVISGTTTADTSTTNGSGTATFTVTDTTVENQTYTATDSGELDLTSTAVYFTPRVADNDQSSATAEQNPIAANGSATSTIEVHVLDNNNVPLIGDVVTLAANSGTSVISGTTTADTSTTGNNGDATFTVTDATVQSDITYTATDGGPLDVTTGTVDFIPPADNALSTAVASPASEVADLAGYTEVVVTVKDADGVTLNGDEVYLCPTGGGNDDDYFCPTGPSSAVVYGDTYYDLSFTNSSGQAFFWIDDSVAETGTFTATDNGSLDLVTNPVTFTAQTADNSQSGAVASPTSVVANGEATSTVTVNVDDANGVPMGGDVVTLAANSGTSVISGTTSADTSTTDNDGNATFTVTDTKAEGGLSYTATDSGSLDVVSNAVTFTPAADNQYSSAVASPGYVEADGVATSTIVVTVKDSLADTISGDVVTLVPLSGGAVVAGHNDDTNTTTTDANGVAVFTVSDTTREDVTFSATDSGTLHVLSNEVDFTYAAANNTLSTITATGPVAANGVATSTVTVTVNDDNAVAVVGDIVTLTPSSGTVGITGSGITNGQGVAVFTATDTVAESGVTFLAEDGLNPLYIVSNPVTFTPTADNTPSTAVAGPSSVLANGVATATVTVTVKDHNAAAIPGDPVTLTANSVHPVISGSGLTNGAGVAIFTVTDTTAQKAIIFTATDTGSLDVVTGAVAFTPTTIAQTGTHVATVLTTASAGFTAQLGVTGNFGAVTFHKTGGSAQLGVSAAGLVRTSGSLPEQIYTIAGTTTSANGDLGTFAFTLTVKLPPLTGPTVSIKDHTSTTILGKDAAAPPGTKATVMVYKAGKLVTQALRLVDGNRRINYATGVLTTGSYKVVFMVAGKVVKTTIVTVG